LHDGRLSDGSERRGGNEGVDEPAAVPGLEVHVEGDLAEVPLVARGRIEDELDPRLLARAREERPIVELSPGGRVRVDGNVSLCPLPMPFLLTAWLTKTSSVALIAARSAGLSFGSFAKAGAAVTSDATAARRMARPLMPPE
jgi:hypothetical protein